jgi:hypothetical protein
VTLVKQKKRQLMLKKRFLITGGQLHGNLDAAAMVIATIESARDL